MFNVRLTDTLTGEVVITPVDTMQTVSINWDRLDMGTGKIIDGKEIFEYDVVINKKGLYLLVRYDPINAKFILKYKEMAYADLINEDFVKLEP